MLNKYSFIIPVYNEEKNISRNIALIKGFAKNLNHEIIVVDDCSSDDTYQILKNNRNIKLIHKSVNQGKGSAIKTGLKYAVGEFIIIIDSDLQIKPEEVNVFLRLLHLYNADVVIGNKRHLYSNVKYSLSRRLVSLCYHIVIKVLFNFPLRDTQCGLKVFKKEVLNMVMDKILIKQYAFDLEVLVALYDNHIRIVDAPVYIDKQGNAGSVRLSTVIKTFIDTLAIWYRRKKGWYKCIPIKKQP